MAVYQTKTQNESVKIFSKNQLRLSSIAFLTAGIGLFVIFFMGLIFSQVFKNASPATMNALQITAPIALITSLILTIVWQFKVMNASMLFRIITISVYCLANGIGFGSLFVAIEMSELIAIFGITGAVCLASFIVSKFLSPRIAFGLSKIIGVMFIIYFAIMITTFFTWIFGFNNGSFNNILNVVIAVLMPILLILILIYQFWMISKMDEFVLDQQQSVAFGMFLGFSLLIIIIQIVYQIIFILRYL